MKDMKDDDLDLSQLEQFTGTEGYIKGWLGVLWTEGIGYLIENGYSWFVTDVSSVLKCNEQVKNEEFVVIKLKLNNKKATAEYSEGNNKKLFVQEYVFTDAKKELTLYYTNGVLMLCGEY